MFVWDTKRVAFFISLTMFSEAFLHIRLFDYGLRMDSIQSKPLLVLSPMRLVEVLRRQSFSIPSREFQSKNSTILCTNLLNLTSLCSSQDFIRLFFSESNWLYITSGGYKGMHVSDNKTNFLKTSTKWDLRQVARGENTCFVYLLRQLIKDAIQLRQDRTSPTISTTLLDSEFLSRRKYCSLEIWCRELDEHKH